MHYSAKGAHGHANPPDRSVAAVDVVHPPAQPDAEETAQLVAEEHDAVKRAHVAQPVDMRDEAGGQRHRGEPERAHAHRKQDHRHRRDREHDEGRGDHRAPDIDPRQQVFLGIALASPARQQRARDIGQTNERDRHRAKRRGGGDADVVQHAARKDRAAHLGHEGREMGGDEGKLVAAGEKAEEDQRIGGVAEGFAEDLAHRLFKLRPARHRGRAHHRQSEQHQQDRPRETHEGHLPGHEAQHPFRHWRAEDLARAARRRGNRQRHRAVLVRGRPPHNGEDHAEPGARDAEADEPSIGLMFDRRRGIGRQEQPHRIDHRPDDNRPPIANLLGQRAKDRLPNAPSEVLDRDGEGELAARPCEFLGNGDLEHAEGGPHGEADHDDDTSDHQDRGEQGRAALHGSVPFRGRLWVSRASSIAHLRRLASPPALP